MFSLLLSGRLGELLAPRPDFDCEVSSLVKAGHFEAALKLLRSHTDETDFLNKLDRVGLALIHVASASGAMEFLVELISRGVEINLPASSGSTALHFAATNNRKGIIEVLLLSGADPSIPNESGHLASELTSDKDIKMFLSRDPSHAMTTRSSRYALSAINQARQSLKAHVESYQNDQSDTPDIGLEKLTISDQRHTADSEKASAPVEAVSPRKQNLHLHSVPNVELGSSSKNVLNYSNKSCEFVENDSDEAEEREGLKQAVFKAATDTADATQNIEGASARRSVAEICQSTRYFARNEPTLRKWLEFDPSLAYCRAEKLENLAQDGYTLLHVAAKYNNLEAMRVLLEYKYVSTWAVDLQGRTPLHIAAGEGHNDACDFLRKKMQEQSDRRVDPIGIDAPVDLNGTTPVGWAAVRTRGNPSPAIKKALFQAGDKTVLPSTPVRFRAGTSPRRKTERINLTNGRTVSSSEEIIYAYSAAQGWKAEMEDKVLTLSPVSCIPHWSFFAVCDGHGGDFVAEYLSQNLAIVLSKIVYKIESEKGKIDEDAGSDIMVKVLHDTCEAADYEISRQPRMKIEKKEDDIICKDRSGSTGLLCLISKRFIVVANVGDSRALLAQWGTVPAPGPIGAGPGVCVSPPQAGTIDPSIPPLGPLGIGPGVCVSPPQAGTIDPTISPLGPLGVGPGECVSPPQGETSDPVVPPTGILVATALSVDHKFSILAERERAERAGATVSVLNEESAYNNTETLYEVSTRRFQKGTRKLRMSRSFGDYYLKQTEDLPSDKQAVTAVPDIVVSPRSINDAFVLLACDGVYDVMSNQEIVDLLARNLGFSVAGGPCEGPTMTRCAEACDQLLKECVIRGAHDNLSALIIMCGSKVPYIVQHDDAPSQSQVEIPQSKFSESSLQSPGGATSQSLESPTSGSRNRTPTDRTLSRVFSTQSPDEERLSEGESVNRHLEFTRELK